MSKDTHLQILNEIKNHDTDDYYAIHNILFPMMDEDGFEPDHEILSEIFTEHPELAEEIQIFKHIVKEVREAFRNIEKSMSPY